MRDTFRTAPPHDAVNATLLPPTGAYQARDSAVFTRLGRNVRPCRAVQLLART
ncbi:Uncharacterised protein [Comamonas aquatica]|uniref:Uncharacterized protein n=1 Tax=Comamonas aquatica TaxID=225991 RepID=A0AA35D7B8_9BURK|nr:Uncharacterised protein [Comamonas aquatica]CAC9686402.1 Uncharacterised protein [Comamonas aquatica]